MAATILLVEDEPAIQELIAYNLHQAGHQLLKADSAEQAFSMVQRELPDLVLLDWMLPGVSGVEFARRLRGDRRTRDVPIIMLTARSDEQDKLTGLDTGADDYITKPFSLAEFKSRVKAALRRGGLRDRGAIQTEIEAGDLAIDVERRKVKVRGKDTTLTYIEFEILVALASEPGKVMCRKQLLEDIWGASGFRSPRTVDVHMRHLREKLEKNPKKPEYLFTVRGVGYRFRDEEAA